MDDYKIIADLVKDFNNNKRSTRNNCVFGAIMLVIFDLMILAITIGSGGLYWVGGLVVILVMGSFFYFSFIKHLLWSFSKKYMWNKTISKGKTKLLDTDGIVFVEKGALILTASDFYYRPESDEEETLIEVLDGKRISVLLANSELYQLRTEDKMLIIFNDILEIADMGQKQEIIKII